MARSTIFLHCVLVSMFTSLHGVSHADLDIAEAGRSGTVAGPHRLHRLTLAAVRHAPFDVLLPAADSIAGVPEAGRDATVTRVLEHAAALAVLDLPGNLGGELEVVAQVIDRPGLIGFHQHPVS